MNIVLSGETGSFLVEMIASQTNDLLDKSSPEMSRRSVFTGSVRSLSGNAVEECVQGECKTTLRERGRGNWLLERTVTQFNNWKKSDMLEHGTSLKAIGGSGRLIKELRR